MGYFRTLTINGYKFECIHQGPGGVIVDGYHTSKEWQDGLQEAVRQFNLYSSIDFVFHLYKQGHKPSHTHWGNKDTGDLEQEIGMIKYAIDSGVVLSPDERGKLDEYLLTAEWAHNLQRQIEAREEKRRDGYVYLIQADNGVYKIGRSQNPKSRIKRLGITLPYEIGVIHLIKSNQYIKAEKQLHDRFASKRLKGEWFDLSDDDVTEIKGISEINFEVSND